jgi:ubiquinone/menaquinone biosynthesis C-methylase UbiE
MPSFGAGLYDNLTSVRGVSRLFEDIARTVADILQEGRLLDIGTGPGRLLAEFNRQIPKLELFGLDISASMLKVAAKNLEHVGNVDLKLRNIVHTDYQDDFFDCMVSSGSFYNWDKPVEGLNEVYRILKPGRKAFIFETCKDHDKSVLKQRLNENLRGYGAVRRLVSKHFLKKQLRMSYSLAEFHTLVKQSKFQDTYAIEPAELGNLPVYVRIELRKV